MILVSYLLLFKLSRSLRWAFGTIKQFPSTEASASSERRELLNMARPGMVLPNEREFQRVSAFNRPRPAATPSSSLHPRLMPDGLAELTEVHRRQDLEYSMTVRMYVQCGQRFVVSGFPLA
jgi:hypothetical protein